MSEARLSRAQQEPSGASAPHAPSLKSAAPGGQGAGSSAAPAATTRRPADELVSGRAGRAPSRLFGTLAPEPLGRLGRGLVYGTGLFLLRPVAAGLGRLVGLRRTASFSIEPGAGLRIRRSVSLLGASLREEDELLDAAQIVSVATCRRTPPEPLAAGALAAAVGIIWGLWQVADGIYGRSAGLVALGLLAATAGVAVDLLVFHLAQRVAWLSQQGARIFLRDGRCITAWGTSAPEPFARAVRAVVHQAEALGGARPTTAPDPRRARSKA